MDAFLRLLPPEQQATSLSEATTETTGVGTPESTAPTPGDRRPSVELTLLLPCIPSRVADRFVEPVCLKQDSTAVRAVNRNKVDAKMFYGTSRNC